MFLFVEICLACVREEAGVPPLGDCVPARQIREATEPPKPDDGDDTPRVRWKRGKAGIPPQTVL
jgi:hypothetical protein